MRHAKPTRGAAVVVIGPRQLVSPAVGFRALPRIPVHQLRESRPAAVFPPSSGSERAGGRSNLVQVSLVLSHLRSAPCSARPDSASVAGRCSNRPAHSRCSATDRAPRPPSAFRGRRIQVAQHEIGHRVARLPAVEVELPERPADTAGCAGLVLRTMSKPALTVWRPWTHVSCR